MFWLNLHAQTQRGRGSAEGAWSWTNLSSYLAQLWDTFIQISYTLAYIVKLYIVYILLGKRSVFVGSFNFTFICMLCTNSCALHIIDRIRMLFKVTDISSSLHMSQIHICLYPFLTFKTTMCAIQEEIWLFHY